MEILATLIIFAALMLAFTYASSKASVEEEQYMERYLELQRGGEVNDILRESKKRK